MNKRTKFFIGVLIVLVLILFIISVFLPKAPPTAPPPPTPTVVPQGDREVLKQQETIRKNQYPLIDKTPYKTSFFEVSYVGPLKLKVVMLDKDQEKIKEEVEKWIKDNGFDPLSHRVEYVTPALPY